MSRPQKRGLIMPIYNNKDENKSYASTGVGTTALVLSSVATAAVTGLIGGGNGLGGLFGGNNQNPANNATYQLALKDNEIALLKSQQYTDNKVMAISERLAHTESRIVALETAAPLRDQIITNGLANLSEKVNGICSYCVPNRALNPGYGPAWVAPMPPPFTPVAPSVSGGTTATPATTSAAA